MEQKEINEIMGYKYISYPVKNPQLEGLPQENGNVSTSKKGGWNVYDGAQNWIGWFDTELNWTPNGKQTLLTESWKKAALDVLEEHKNK